MTLSESGELPAAEKRHGFNARGRDENSAYLQHARQLLQLGVVQAEGRWLSVLRRQRRVLRRIAHRT